MLQLIESISPLAICVLQCITIIYVTAQIKYIVIHLSTREAKRIFKMVRKLLNEK